MESMDSGRWIRSWCDERSLSRQTAEALLQDGFTTPRHLVSLNNNLLHSLDISLGDRILLLNELDLLRGESLEPAAKSETLRNQQSEQSPSKPRRKRSKRQKDKRKSVEALLSPTTSVARVSESAGSFKLPTPPAPPLVDTEPHYEHVDLKAKLTHPANLKYSFLSEFTRRLFARGVAGMKEPSSEPLTAADVAFDRAVEEVIIDMTVKDTPYDSPKTKRRNKRKSKKANKKERRSEDYERMILRYPTDDSDTGGIGVCGWLLTALSWIIVLMTMPFSFFTCFKVVQEYERAVIFRLGRLLSGGAKGPGIFFILPCIETYTKVDLRTTVFDIPPQEILTKDSVTVSVDAVVYFRVSNATISVANVENAHHSTRLLAQTSLRNILGTKNLHEILGDRENISGDMKATLDEATENWGIKVERVEIKDVRLPVQLQRAMAAEAEAAREARAKVIAAEGEQKAANALKEASIVIAQSPAALQLRYLQTLSAISAEKNSTIIFPLPMDFLSPFLNFKDSKPK